MHPEVQAAIERAALEHGIDPTFALAVADRESGGDVNARSNKTIAGLFQMQGGLRQKYGAGDSADPYTQASAWMPFIKDTKREMSAAAGRDVSDPELYAGHFFGGTRAGRMLRMGPQTPVDQVFTPNEISQNPSIASAGTVGRLMRSVTSDISNRQTKFNSDLPDFSGEAEGAAEKPDLSSFGTPLDASDGTGNINIPSPTTAPDFSDQGTPVDNPMMIKGPVQTLGIRG